MSKSNHKWIQTHSGIIFYPGGKGPREYDIRDIAHGTALECRFNRQVRTFYSTAQHSLILAWLAPKRLQLAGLLHDGDEAYLPDVPTPLAYLCPRLKTIARRINSEIAAKFGFQYPLNPKLKEIDLRLAVTERQLFNITIPNVWPDVAKPYRIKILPMSPIRAELAFLHAFNKIKRGQKLEQRDVGIVRLTK